MPLKRVRQLQINRFDFLSVEFSSTRLIAGSRALFGCSKQVKCTNRILFLSGLANTAQRKDETEKTEAETERKTTDGKSFFVKDRLLMYPNQ